MLARPPGLKEFEPALWPWAQRIPSPAEGRRLQQPGPTRAAGSGLLLFGGAIHCLALPASSAPPARLLPWSLRDPAPQEEDWPVVQHF